MNLNFTFYLKTTFLFNFIHLISLVIKLEKKLEFRTVKIHTYFYSQQFKWAVSAPTKKIPKSNKNNLKLHKKITYKKAFVFIPLIQTFTKVIV